METTNRAVDVALALRQSQVSEGGAQNFNMLVRTLLFVRHLFSCYFRFLHVSGIGGTFDFYTMEVDSLRNGPKFLVKGSERIMENLGMKADNPRAKTDKVTVQDTNCISDAFVRVKEILEVLISPNRASTFVDDKHQILQGLKVLACNLTL